MNYEKIILELLSRVKDLEDEVRIIKEKTLTLPTNEPTPILLKSYKKTTDEMIMLCYKFGKKAFENSSTHIVKYAKEVAISTNMNTSSAFMYIYVVKSLLEGNVFKRAINSKALDTYLELISEEYGKNGLTKALNATKQHIEYRKKFNHPIDSIIKIYNKYNK